MSAHGEENAVDGPTVQDPFQQRDPWAQATQAGVRDVPPAFGADIPAGFGVQPGVSSNITFRQSLNRFGSDD